MLLTYKFRVKSKAGLLRKQARAVNFVWNYCNNTQKNALRWRKKWPTGFDLNRLTSGTSKDLGLNSQTIAAIGAQYAKSRSQKNRPYLRYRGKKSLGWVPVKATSIRQSGPDAFKFMGENFRVFMSRQIPAGATIRDGSSFSEVSEGNWYLNLVLELPDVPLREIKTVVGIDLGLKEFATLSTGEKIAAPQFYRKLESKLGVSQRAKKKKQARKIHAKIKNARKDFHHKLSTSLVKRFDGIAVGNVSSSGLAKTSMAKSVNDAGWSAFRNMLRYKAITHGCMFAEVAENSTTQICSFCHGKTGPKGLIDLGIRQWVCSACGVGHDRDHNAAKNILARLGHQAPAEGIQHPIPGVGGCQGSTLTYFGVNPWTGNRF